MFESVDPFGVEFELKTNVDFSVQRVVHDLISNRSCPWDFNKHIPCKNGSFVHRMGRHVMVIWLKW